MLKYSSTRKGNSPRNFFTDRRQSIIILVLAVVVFLVVLPFAVRLVVSIVMRPLTAVTIWLRESTGVIPVYVRSREELDAKIESLQTVIDSQQGMEISLKDMVEENIALRAAMGEGVTTRLLARVVGRPPFLAYDRLQLDKGSDDAVAIGAPVFVGKNIVIGSVVEVGPDYSFVELVTAPGFESTVYLPASSLVATMEGQGGGIGRVRYPQGIEVAAGDLVVGLAYESGVFGEVMTTAGESTQPEKYAYVPLPVPLQSLRYVTVGQPLPSPHAPAEVASSTRALLDTLYRQPLVAPELAATTTIDLASTTATGTSSSQ